MTTAKVTKKRTKKTSLKTLSSATRYLLDQTDFERMRVVRYNEETFKLDRMRTLLKELGNPQDTVTAVHIAGTVGKGSTVAMISAMLRGNGYAVGEYTSPHLTDIRERIVVNAELIPEDTFVSNLKTVVDAAEKKNLEPTFFELMTAVAFKYFADEAIDVAVIETGLGGRLDSTNVINPILTLITQIDLDHTHILGKSVEEIAKEKAGIFKNGAVAISSQQSPEVSAVLRDCAQQADTELSIIGDDIEFSSRFGGDPDGNQHTRICLITGDTNYMHVPVPLDGEHQAKNCALAIAAIDKLKKMGYRFNDLAMYDNLATTTMEGRMEIIWQRPRVLVDGAHNPIALSTLMKSVGAHIPYDSMVCIFGCCQDKDIEKMLHQVSLGADKIIFTKAKGNPRAADPIILQKRFEEISGKMTQAAASFPEALEIAAQAASRDDLICVTGSFYLVGEAKKHLKVAEAKKT